MKTASMAATPSRGNVALILGLAAGLLFFLVSGAINYRNIQHVRDSDLAIRKTQSVLSALQTLLSQVQDAETGQRGYMITANKAYLAPYETALARIPVSLETLRGLTRSSPQQTENLRPLARQIDTKLAELKETIDVRRSQGATAAYALVNEDRGKAAMEAIRAQVAVMAAEEQRQRDIRIAQMASASNAALLSGLLSALFGIVLTCVVFALVLRADRNRIRQQWLQAGLVGLSDRMRGEKSVAEVADATLSYLAGYLGAPGGALFKREGHAFHRGATLGVPADADVPKAFGLGEGLLGKVASDGEVMVLADVPEPYLTIGSALGRGRPRHLVIVPLLAADTVNAVMELGFFEPVGADVLELLTAAAAPIGVSLRSARYRAQLQHALDETRRQAGELQAQSEELRVSNEELEEQGRALQESQARLELQQVELEQTNSQLEEQTEQLAVQRDELERQSSSLQLKARELEQASRYKSDFLANMSHELRTPLNSLLILAKLLADDPKETLSDEQRKFARTIESSGRDLLVLINDILDLSKIEAGHMVIQPGPVGPARLVADLKQLFQPTADERGLGFEIELGGDVPKIIETDRLRLEQILKNLLSNAFKFTASGQVRLRIAPAPGERLSFVVADSGIGITKEQQSIIFEAFHQADGTISRKFGGTGLGLSISRELARLLGGEIGVESEPGKGSRFTLLLPLVYDPGLVAPRREPVAMASVPAPVPVRPSPPALKGGHQADAQETRPLPVAPAQRPSDRRLLLVIEDDKSFADIICELSGQLGFECEVAGTAEEAVQMARAMKPDAIVLDVGLPDQSGLTVLDRLKQDDDLRHIPVHVVSAMDQSQTALSLGAVGYLTKPVLRERLADVLQGLQAKLATRMRRVLIVEDDPVQREAVSRLLVSDEVETVGVGTAADCLRELQGRSYDCMVLDLSLPDASGYTLLETLSAEGGRGFPPVIVYTGQEISADDEQRLRRYSSSIIIKGAKSPERLLDEVSLFLHQVVSELPPERRRMIRQARHRDAVMEGRRVLIVEDDVRNVYSLTSVLEPRGAIVEIARNGEEALAALNAGAGQAGKAIDIVLMDVMMPVMDGLTATRAIRSDPRFAAVPVIALTAKAMPDDQPRCLDAGASDYLAKPIDVDKLLSLIRVWMPR